MKDILWEIIMEDVMSMYNTKGTKRSTTRLIHECVGDDRTKQSFKEQCDINSIVAKGRARGFIEHINSRPAFYDDVSNVPSYQEALQIVIDADTAFMSLPAKVRERFGNDPGKMIDFIQDENNIKESRDLGLVKKEPENVNVVQPEVKP